LIKPQESSIREKISKINKILAQQLLQKQEQEKAEEQKKQTENPEYRKYIKLANDAFENKLLSVSKAYYLQAMNIVETDEVKQQLKAIDTMISKLKNNKLHQKFEEYVMKADKEFEKKQWAVARHYYNQAKGTNINNKYCEKKIKEIEVIIKNEALAKKQKEIDDLIAKANSAMKKNDFSIAKFYFNKVLELDKDNKIAQDGLKLIKEKLK
jgi:hypothetical protein